MRRKEERVYTRSRGRWRARAPEVTAGLPVAEASHWANPGECRAGALPKGSTLHRAGRSGAREVAVLRCDLGAVGELAGAQGDVERARAHVDVTPAGGRGRQESCRGVRCAAAVATLGRERERGREGGSEGARARVRASEGSESDGARGAMRGPVRHAGFCQGRVGSLGCVARIDVGDELGELGGGGRVALPVATDDRPAGHQSPRRGERRAQQGRRGTEHSVGATRSIRG